MENSQSPVVSKPSKKAKLKASKQKIVALVVGVVLVVAVVVASGWFFYRLSTAATINNDRYQAVFFTSGQVYFGKLNQVNAGYFRLTDVFYIQAQEADATKDASANPQQATTQSTDIRLIKLGSEVHGPADEMIISKDQILFFENLKSDGKVSDSITKYNQQKK